MREAPPRILIIDRESLFADAISPELARAGFAIVETCRTFEEGALALRRAEADVIVLDPEADGGDDEGAFRSLSSHTSGDIVLISSTLDHERVTRAISLGYRGVISKEVRLARVIEALRAVAAGDIAIETGNVASGRRIASGPVVTARAAGSSLLTPREREVLALLTQGADGAEIARRLSLSPHTVRTHIHNIMHKLQVHSRAEAASFAVRNGLVAADPPPSAPEVA